MSASSLPNFDKLNAEAIDNEDMSRQFNVLDKISEDQNSNNTDNDSDGSFSYDWEMLDKEIDAMMEEAYPEKFKNRKRKRSTENDDDSENPYEERDKIVLVEKEENTFDILPEGWIQITHNSGMPVYLHRNTRVCTFSKPYYLGPASSRKHNIPLSAIPCLNYKRAVETEVEEKAGKTTEPEPKVSVGGLPLPNTLIETLEENFDKHSLAPTQLRNYCQRLFQFKIIKVMSLLARQQLNKRRKHERPTFPYDTKLISSDNWSMNLNGKSYICILHEYVQHALKTQPKCKFVELRIPTTRYMAITLIYDTEYGVGFGTNKKKAKSDAAKATLEMLIPEMRAKITADEKAGGSTTSELQDKDLSFFDEVKVEDPRVAEFSDKKNISLPYNILSTCLQRNFGLSDMDIKHHGNTLEGQKYEFTMTVGKHRATVICKNERDGKQRASQKILQVAWIKADTKAILAIHEHVITNNARLSVTHNDYNTWTLNIRSVRREDRGQYMCQVNTDPMKMQTAFLEVVIPPDIVYEETSGDMMVPEGGSAKLVCKSRGYPQPRITWKREDGGEIIARGGPTGKTKLTSVEGEVLTLTKVTRSEMGAYLCIAANGVPPSVSKRMMLHVHFHPLIQVPNQLVGAPTGTDVTLQCHVEASPKAINYWTRDTGEMIISNDKYLMTEINNSYYSVQMRLVIRNFCKTDLGGYKCISKNSIGDAEGNIRLYEMELPYRGKNDEDSNGEDSLSEHEGSDLVPGGSAGMVSNGPDDSAPENRHYNGYQGSLMEPGDNSVPHDGYDRSNALIPPRLCLYLPVLLSLRWRV